MLSEKHVTESRLAALNQQAAGHSPMSMNEIRSLVSSMGGLLNALRRSDPADKHQVYRQLGVKLTYNDNTRMVIAEAIPSVCVKNVSGGGYKSYPQATPANGLIIQGPAVRRSSFPGSPTMGRLAVRWLPVAV
ncbi:hypothetical protein [Nocardia sp. NPDC003979]